MGTQAIQRQSDPFQSAFTGLAFLAIGLLLIGPFIDPYFAQRTLDHQHLGPSYSYPHAHVYDMAASQTPLPQVQPAALEALERSLAAGIPSMLPSQEAAAAFAILSPSAPAALPLGDASPKTPSRWRSFAESFATLTASSIDPLEQPPR